MSSPQRGSSRPAAAVEDGELGGAFDPQSEPWLPDWMALGEGLELPDVAPGCADPRDSVTVTIHDTDIEGDETWTCDSVHVLDGPYSWKMAA